MVNILATLPTRNIEAKEDEALSTEGLQVRSYVDNFATLNTYSFASEPLLLPDPEAYPLKGRLVGWPVQGQAGAFNYIAAPTLMQAQSDGASGTVLRFIEYE
jgi:hypothetical protein